jgi:hypothetical protein
MKKLLIILLFFSACSITDLSPESQKWIASIYNQGWYWPSQAVPNTPSGKLVPFQSDGSFVVGTFTPWNGREGDLPLQYNTKLILDEVLHSSEAYYRFTYRFNGENLTLYYDIFHGYLNTTREPGIFWGSKEHLTPPSSTSSAVLKAWLLATYSKDVFAHRGYALGLKKSRRSITSEDSASYSSNAPTSDNTSGTMKN